MNEYEEQEYANVKETKQLSYRRTLLARQKYEFYFLKVV